LVTVAQCANWGRLKPIRSFDWQTREPGKEYLLNTRNNGLDHRPKSQIYFNYKRHFLVFYFHNRQHFADHLFAPKPAFLLQFDPKFHSAPLSLTITPINEQADSLSLSFYFEFPCIIKRFPPSPRLSTIPLFRLACALRKVLSFGRQLLLQKNTRGNQDPG